MSENVVGQMHQLIEEVVPILKEATQQRRECKEVGDQLLLVVKPLLDQIQDDKIHLTPTFVDFLRELHGKVIRLKKQLQELNNRSWVKHVFPSSALTGQIHESLDKVQWSLRVSLPSVQSKIVREMEREMQQLKVENMELRNNRLPADQRQVDQSLANGEENIVSRSKALLDDLVPRSKTVLVPFTEWKPLADRLTGLENQADAAAVVNLGVIPFFVRLLEGNEESATVARALENIIRLDPTSSPSLAATQGIAVLCKMLPSAGSSTSFDDVPVLELLALASEELRNKKEIVRHRGVPLLVTASSRGTGAKQEMALTTLLNLSREIHKPESDNPFVTALATSEVCKCLLDIISIREDPPTEKAVVMAISIVRNVSLSGEYARALLMQEGRGAISILLDRIQNHDAVASDIVRVSAVALEKFTTTPEGREKIIRYDGVNNLTDLLRLTVHNPQIKIYAAKILGRLTEGEDRQFSKDACTRILKAGVIKHLESMLKYEHIGGTQPSSDVPNQACVLLKNLLNKAPSKSDVCTAIRGSKCIPKLLQLKCHDRHSAANAVLEELKNYDSQFRKQISSFKPSRSIS